MKNIEKIAIDSLIEQFSTKNREHIERTLSAKSALEIAQANFKKTAGALTTNARDIATFLIQDDVSEDAIKYFDDSISNIIKIPFTSRSK